MSRVSYPTHFVLPWPCAALLPLFVLTMMVGASARSQTKDKEFVPDWVKDAVFYQIFPERFANGDTSNDPPGTQLWGGTPTPSNFFGGDLRGILDHLDYLSALGVNAVYLNPIFESPSNHKYNTADYLRIDPHFGTEETFRRLVDSLHARGIRIILDGVFNHTGVDFFAFQDIRKNGARSPYLGWYNVFSLPLRGPSKPNYEAWWGIGTLPKLMTLNPDVRQYLFAVARHWLHDGIDGWRLDVPNEVPHEFWRDWRKVVKEANPDAYIVGEIWDNGSPWLKGDEFDAVMNYRFRNACLSFFAEKSASVSRFDSLLAHQRRDYPDQVNHVLQNLLDSHDTERLLTSCRGDLASMKLAVLFQMTYLGAPMVYYGDEVGMEGGKDPGCRGTMVWDTSKQNRDLLRFYRGVIRLRNRNPVLRRGNFQTVKVDNAHEVYAFQRRMESSVAVVILNRSAEMQTVRVQLPADQAAFEYEVMWPESSKGATVSGVSIQTSVPPESGVVFIGGKGK